MFNVTNKPAELQHVSFFTEKHGDEDKHGVALRFEMTTVITALDDFDTGLTAALYRPADIISAQRAPAADQAHVPRFPRLTHQFDHQIVGAVVLIQTEGLFGRDKIRLTECVVDKFRPTLKEAAIDWIVRIKCWPDADIVGALYELQKQTVSLTVEPPSMAKYEPKPADTQTGSLLPGDGDVDTADAAAAAFAAQDEAAAAKPKRGRKAADAGAPA